VVTVILLVIWVIWKVFTDRDCHPHSSQHALQHDASGTKLEPTGDASWNWDFWSRGNKGSTVAHGQGSVVHSPNAAPVVGKSVTGPF
jgi:hypothetical protein